MLYATIVECGPQTRTLFPCVPVSSPSCPHLALSPFCFTVYCRFQRKPGICRLSLLQQLSKKRCPLRTGKPRKCPQRQICPFGCWVSSLLGQSQSWLSLWVWKTLLGRVYVTVQTVDLDESLKTMAAEALPFDPLPYSHESRFSISSENPCLLGYFPSPFYL